MQNVAVLYPECSSKSAKALALAIDAVAINPFKSNKKDYRGFDLVINYGCNRNIKAERMFNPVRSVACCIDKRQTFHLLNQHKIPTVGWVLDKEAIPKSWKHIVVRGVVDGNKNEGCETYHRNQKKRIPENAPLYTEFFEHKKEFRIIVFNKAAVVAYEKKLIDEEWNLIEKQYKYLDPVRKSCLDAAKVLQIDFVGFDVLVGHDNSFVILEANSAPILTDEAIVFFKNYVRRMK